MVGHVFEVEESGLEVTVRDITLVANMRGGRWGGVFNLDLEVMDGISW